MIIFAMSTNYYFLLFLKKVRKRTSHVDNIEQDACDKNN